MNMISTGGFVTEMDVSDKQPTLAEKFAVWERKCEGSACRWFITHGSVISACGLTIQRRRPPQLLQLLQRLHQQDRHCLY